MAKRTSMKIAAPLVSFIHAGRLEKSSIIVISFDVLSAV